MKNQSNRYRNFTARCPHGFALGVVRCVECDPPKKMADKYLAGAAVLEHMYGEDMIMLECPECEQPKRINRSWIYKLHGEGKRWLCNDCRASRLLTKRRAM